MPSKTAAAYYWDQVIGQEEAVDTLTTSLASGNLSHAYLFVGPEGLGKINAARAIAASLMCGENSCGTCFVCERLNRGTHPDFNIIEPEGSGGYLVDQIRTLMHDISLRPMEANHKVYVIRSAGLLNISSANAFLKTLEEPPSSVTLILLAHTSEPVLPTIVSRCVVVRFRSLPREDMIMRLVERTGASKEEALIALAATGSVLGQAASFLTSHARRAARDEIIRIFFDLPDLDGAEVLQAASSLLIALNGPVEEMRIKQELDLAKQADLLDERATKALKAHNKRRQSAYEKRNIGEMLNTLQSLLRDTLIISQGAEQLALNGDVRERLGNIAYSITPAKTAQAFDAIEQARTQLSSNVTARLLVEALLFEIREVLQCPR